MWPRTAEVMIAVWLLMSPFIFGHQEALVGLWITDFACAVLIATCSLLSFRKGTHRAYLFNIAIALWLMVFGYVAGGHPSQPGYQNEIFVGLVLILFAILPNRANEPPRSWREYYEDRIEATRRL